MKFFHFKLACIPTIFLFLCSSNAEPTKTSKCNSRKEGKTGSEMMGKQGYKGGHSHMGGNHPPPYLNGTHPHPPHEWGNWTDDDFNGTHPHPPHEWGNWTDDDFNGTHPHPPHDWGEEKPCDGFDDNSNSKLNEDDESINTRSNSRETSSASHVASVFAPSVSALILTGALFITL